MIKGNDVGEVPCDVYLAIQASSLVLAQRSWLNVARSLVKMSYLTLVVLATLSVFAAGLSSRQVNGGEREVVYRQFHIDSKIVARYSTTTIKGVIFNRANSSQELSFQVQLPETAFISNFSMLVSTTPQTLRRTHVNTS